MQRAGWPVDLARMCADSAYTHRCLALAQTSADIVLRRAALDLFARYDGVAVVLH
jgi:hypothetical protein